MVTQNTVISFEQLVRDFDSLFQHRVFRLETLDWYDAPNEREPYARFLAGQPADSAWREPWKRLVRETRASGRIMQRVHVVSEPVSDYARFELLRVYPANVEAGEDVRILGRQNAASLPTMDFWLFDDSLAAILTYDETGAVSQVELDDTPGRLRWYVDDRERALRLATPLVQYVAEHSITEGRTQAA
jgi:hypothetical protein